MAVQSAESSQTEIIQVIIQDEPTNSKIIDIISDFIACVLTHTYILYPYLIYIYLNLAVCNASASGSKLDKNCQTEPVTKRDQACQTDMDFAWMENEKSYLEHLLEELANLKSQLLSVQFSEETFKENNEKTKFYTGLPNYQTLMSVFNLTSPCIKRNSQNALEPFSEFILVLLRLKLNLPLQELAYRFNISLATASRIFDRWIHVMSIRLKFLIH